MEERKASRGVVCPVASVYVTVVNETVAWPNAQNVRISVAVNGFVFLERRYVHDYGQSEAPTQCRNTVPLALSGIFFLQVCKIQNTTVYPSVGSLCDSYKRCQVFVSEQRNCRVREKM